MLIQKYKKIYFSIKYANEVICIDIDNQIIKIRINNFNEEHFKKLGYNFKKNDYVYIPVKHLPNGSGVKIKVQCKYCGKIFEKSYRRYLETKDSICCKECKDIKMVETSIKKYGNRCSLRNEKIQEKSKNKNMINLGVQYPFQNKGILDKCVKTCIEKYGINYKKCIISSQQKYLHSIYGGIINYSEPPYMLDIFFEKEKIYCEYDGSGHNLSVKMGNCTEEDFDKKEKCREQFLKEKGYKEFRIISNDDILPDIDTLLYIKSRAFEFLINKNYSKYTYNLNTKIESFEN